MVCKHFKLAKKKFPRRKGWGGRYEGKEMELNSGCTITFVTHDPWNSIIDNETDDNQVDSSCAPSDAKWWFCWFCLKWWGPLGPLQHRLTGKAGRVRAGKSNPAPASCSGSGQWVGHIRVCRWVWLTWAQTRPVAASRKDLEEDQRVIWFPKLVYPLYPLGY